MTKISMVNISKHTVHDCLVTLVIKSWKNFKNISSLPAYLLKGYDTTKIIIIKTRDMLSGNIYVEGGIIITFF